MKIAIFGLGYVGLTAAACLTKQGHHVLGIDVSEQKVASINAGHSPITEPGVEALLQDALAGRRLRATNNTASELDDCDIAFVCVGTPSAVDGSHNMSHIAEVTRQIASSLNPSRLTPLTVVYRSTVRPGTMEQLIRPIMTAILKDKIDCVELVYNPEFLRESVAVQDFFNPPKIVIGTKDGEPSENMNKLNAGMDAPVFYTGYEEAEFTKFVDNTFHAVKVSFANEIGRLCLSIGISAAKVHEIFVSDTKLNISPYYLRPGGAFGGSCLPKDVRALQFISADVGANTHLIDSLMRSNDSHKLFLYEYCVKDLAPGSRVLLLGLSFKASSDDLRDSPNLDLARRLLQAGFELSILDPDLAPAKLVGQNLGYVYSQLPSLAELLIDHATAQNDAFDLVIDTRGAASQLGLKSSRVIDINRLT
jgi:GDP-mannose 6-dehydrogenase